MLLLEAPDEVLLERMLARGRADDTAEAITRRLELYHSETKPLLDYYGELLVAIDGVGTVDEVQQRALAALEPLSVRLTDRDSSMDANGRSSSRPAASCRPCGRPGWCWPTRSPPAEPRSRPGVSTARRRRRRGRRSSPRPARPATSCIRRPRRRHRRFPATICASVNDEVVHGIPSPSRILRDGDLLSIDAGCILDGWHADSAVSVHVGDRRRRWRRST